MLPSVKEHSPLPPPAPRHRRVSRLRAAVRAASAVVALVLLLGGLPGALLLGTAAVLGNGAPTPAGGGSGLVGVLIRPDNGNLFLWALVVVGWVAWLCFAASVALEIPAQLRGRVARRVAPLAWSQRLAAGLVGAVLATVPATGTVLTASAAPARAATGALPTPGGASGPGGFRHSGHVFGHASRHGFGHGSGHASAAAPAAAPAPRPNAAQGHPDYWFTYYTVRDTRPAESLWSIAEAQLGSGERWVEIARLNEGRVMDASGRPFDPDRPIQPGWQLRVPNHAGQAAAEQVRDRERDRTDRTDRTVTVHEGDTLSSLAERELGSAADWPSLFEANRNAVDGEGHHLTDPNLINPGMVLDVPNAQGAGAPPDQHRSGGGTSPAPSSPGVHSAPPNGHGGASTAPALPSGASPGAATSPSAAASPTSGASPTSAVSPTTGASPTPAPTESGPAVGGASPSAPAGAGVLGSGAAGSGAVSSVGSGATSPEGGSSDVPSVSDPSDLPMPHATEGARASAAGLETTLGGTGLLAAAIVGALALRRRRQQQRRLPGRRIPMPEVEAAGYESALRSRQDAVGLDLVDRALRSLGRTAAREQRRLPAVVAVRVTPAHTVELHLAAPASPLAPFRAAHASTVWWCSPDAEGLLNADTAADLPAPYPALVGIGSAPDGSTVLIDLEAVRLVQFAGERSAALAVLRTLALEFALSPLTDHLRLHLVGGVAPELADRSVLGAERARVRTHRTLDEAIAAVEPRDRAVRERLVAARASHVRDARARGGADDAWTPDIILCAEEPNGEQPAVLGRLLDARPRTCLAVVTAAPSGAGAPVARWTLRVGGGGAPGEEPEPSALPGSRIEVLLQRLDDTEYRHAIALLRTAQRHDDVPAPVVEESEQVEQVEEAEQVEAIEEVEAVAETAEFETANDVAEAAPAEREAETAETAEAEVAPEYRIPPPLPPAEATSPAPAANGSTPAATPEDDILGLLRTPPAEPPADLSTPRIHLLGAVELLGARGPVDDDQRERLTEIAAYIALNPGTDQRALDLLIDPAPRATGGAAPRGGRGLAVAVDRLRDWLGDDPSGRPFLPLDSSRGYAFAPPVGCDWDDFRALHRRGVRAGARGADRALARALALVRGVPFTLADPTGCAWAEPFRQDMVSAIVDTAHELAARRLAVGDHRGAEAAAYRGLAVEPGAELLHRDLLTVYAAAGARDQLLKAVSRLHAQATRDGHGLDPSTTALLRELLET